MLIMKQQQQRQQPQNYADANPREQLVTISIAMIGTSGRLLKICDKLIKIHRQRAE